MNLFRIVFKSTLFLITVFIGIFWTVLFVQRDKPHKEPSSGYIQLWNKMILGLLNVQVEAIGKPETKATLFVSNHVSWMDISVLHSLAIGSFLSKVEVKKWPLVGWLAIQCGTLFIERGSKNAASLANNTMSKAMKNGRSIFLFPEGTTSDGTLRLFHPHLFDSAIEADVCVQPIAIHYLHETQHTHPKAGFLKGQSLGENVKGVMQLPSLKVRVHFLEPLDPKDFKNRKALAKAAREAISNTLYPENNSDKQQ